MPTDSGLTGLLNVPPVDPPGTEWVVVLRPLPGEVPGEVRLRQFLKRALRDWGLKAVHVGRRLPSEDLANARDLLDLVAKLEERLARRARPRAGTV